MIELVLSPEARQSGAAHGASGSRRTPHELWRLRGATDDLRGLAIETSFGYAAPRGRAVPTATDEGRAGESSGRTERAGHKWPCRRSGRGTASRVGTT